MAGLKDGVGIHTLADLFGIAAERLSDAEGLGELLRKAAARSGLRAITEPVVVPFGTTRPEGQSGVTGFLVLAESHIAFHSYPERGYLAVDIFTCGPNAQPQAALDVFVEQLRPKQTIVRSCVRGVSSTDN